MTLLSIVAIEPTGDVPLVKRGSDYFQEDDPNLLFRDVAVYTEMVSAPAGCSPRNGKG